MSHGRNAGLFRLIFSMKQTSFVLHVLSYLRISAHFPRSLAHPKLHCLTWGTKPHNFSYEPTISHCVYTVRTATNEGQHTVRTPAATASQTICGHINVAGQYCFFLMESSIFEARRIAAACNHSGGDVHRTSTIRKGKSIYRSSYDALAGQIPSGVWLDVAQAEPHWLRNTYKSVSEEANQRCLRSLLMSLKVRSKDLGAWSQHTIQLMHCCVYDVVQFLTHIFW